MDNQPPKFKKWLAALSHLKDTQANSEKMINFLAGEMQNPLEMLDFLEFTHQHLASVKRRTNKTKKLAGNILKVLSPLADRYGMFEKKLELEKLCMYIVNPDGYQYIEKIINQYTTSSRLIINRVIKRLRQLLNDNNIQARVVGRFKSYHSILKKMERKKYGNPLDLFDIFAFRILLEKKDAMQCYEVLNLLHDSFTPLPQRFKDYIHIPKINGYQSIHTCLKDVIPELDIPIEVQIRTEQMNDFAKKGLAAHLLYSSVKRSHLLSENEKYLLASLARFSAAEKETENRVFCFSAGGDIFSFPPGATLIDFAFAIHTDLGNKLSAGRVNGRLKPLNYKIKAGDRIILQKSERNQVKNVWLKQSLLSYTHKKIYDSLKI